MSFITVPFSWLLNLFIDTFRSYGVAIILFGVLVKLIMLPFQMKSKHSMMRTTMLAPRMKELEKKYGNNKQKYQEEVSKLYKQEKINPASGCIWSLIPFPILIALYGVVRQPLTKLMGLTADQVTAVTNRLVEIGAYVIPAKKDAYAELTIADKIHEHFGEVQSVVAILKDIDFSFLGMNLSQRPQWNFFATVDWGDVSSWFPAFALFLVPFLSAGLSFLASKLGQKNNPSMEMSGQSTAKTMMLTMPLVSLYICFVMPAAMGVYWIVQSLLSCFEELVLGKYYRRALEKENAQFLERERRREEELEKKREETERLKAEGKTAVNPNTSKRKKQTAERAREEERQAAARAAQRAAEGKNKPVPDSQVGARRFARGRAYIKDRYEQTGDDIEIRDAEGLPDGEIESAAKAAEGYPVSQEDSAAENEYETDAPESEESFDSGDSDGDDQERS